MIQKSEYTIVCPSCHRSFPISAWAIVTAGRLAISARRQVLSAQPFRHACPHCGVTETVAYDCLYSGGRYMVYLLPQSTGALLPLSAKEEQVLGRTGRRPVLRLVRTVPELIEKIRVMEGRVPDRALEIVKSQALPALQERYPGCERMELEARRGDQLQLSLWQRCTRLGESAIDMRQVEKLQKILERTPLGQEPPAYARVDGAWAVSAPVRQLLRQLK